VLGRGNFEPGRGAGGDLAEEHRQDPSQTEAPHGTAQILRSIDAAEALIVEGGRVGLTPRILPPSWIKENQKYMPFALGPMELAIILAIVIFVFGAGKVADLGGALGKGIREFRSAVKEDPTNPTA
jgi:sec-independent protein translocase protein TatA